ncbi:MAG: GGDEF domain-containing protein [Phycisphaerae bacterium]|nr:GGDEF domain-containing protein [Phycisphaerae bacterium]
MIQSDSAPEARLLVVADLKRLGPIVQRCFAPQAIIGVRGYLAGIAEIRQAPTRAVLVGHDVSCRNIGDAIAAMKAAAGDAPVVFCCEPAYEHIGRSLLSHGADDYVIFPPERAELERALGIPSRPTQERWIETPIVAPVPSAEELARLADVLPRLIAGDAGVPDAMATLVCAALNAESTTIVLDGKTGGAGRVSHGQFDAVLTEPISDDEQPIGQIRVGKCCAGGYTHEDTAKLRHYGVLFGRMVAGARRAEEWRRLAMTDDLTGLPNRRRLIEFLEDKLAEATRARSTVTVLYFDIDDFKRYNDEYSHDAGDEILRDVGRLFVQCSRDTDMVARYGGDEFVVAFWDPEGPRTVGSRHPEAVLDVVHRFREALKNHTFERLGPEASGRLTISGGIAHYPWDARTATELIETADRALLRAKAAGKNRFWIVGDVGA